MNDGKSVASTRENPCFGLIRAVLGINGGLFSVNTHDFVKW